jgi:hypothetical protein
MPSVPIPAWTAEGFLPPLDAANPVSSARAPYPVSLTDVVTRFATSAERRAVLQGFLGYRAALHANGYLEGFQWLDGSFMEDIETLESRPPRDIDVVTFMQAAQAASPTPQDVEALDHGVGKQRFKVDGYFLELEAVPAREIAFWSAYWYSMWAHRRNKAWKGFLQIELRPDEDAAAIAWLSQQTSAGVMP